VHGSGRACIGVSAPSEIGRLRLAAQRLLGPPAADAAEAVRRLTAVQAQDYGGAITSVALRTSARSRDEVEGALDAGAVVRTWPMRGTLHFLLAEDVAWMLALLGPRMLRASAGRRAGLELDDAQLGRGRELAVAALAGGSGLTRRELFRIWDDAGLSTASQRGVHLLQYLALTGTVVYGPTRGSQQLLVLSEEWLPAPRRLEREEALAELAWRYFAGHGPATLRDLARWASLTVTDARAGLAAVRPRLEVLAHDGFEHFLDPETPERLAAAAGAGDDVLLLPGFDEFVLGYGERGAVLDTAHAGRIAPGGNGLFRPTVVRGGRVVGTWRQRTEAGRRTLTTEPFEPFPPEVAGAIERAHEALP
jgi:hypothetical protein